MRTKLGVLLFLLLHGTLGAWETWAALANFKPKPDLSADGWADLKVAYPSTLWGARPAGSKGKAWPPRDPDSRDQERIVNLAQRWKAQGRSLVCLDIEHFELRGSAEEAERGVTAIRSVVAWVKRGAPGMKVGIYGTLPLREYKASLLPWGEPLRRAWSDRNARLDELGKDVDVVFPSLYTFEDDGAKWESYARANLTEARRWKKPVLAFLWPRFHNSNRWLGRKFLGKGLWRKQLELVAQQADGVVIWDDGLGKAWDPSCDWWQVARDLSARLSAGH